MRLLIDLGTPVFTVAAVMPDLADLDTAKEILDKKLKKILTRVGATHFIAFVDGRGNFRKKVKEDYKANRKRELPETLNDLQNYAVEKYKAIRHNGIEADDAVAITYEYYKNKYKDIAIVSADKDMQQLSGLHFRIYKSDITRKEIDDDIAFRNLYNQMIEGDSADNVKGIPGYGKAKFISLSRGDMSDLIASTDIPALDMHRKNYRKELEILYLIEQYMFRLGLYKGVEEFSKNFLSLYLKREPQYGFEIPKWVRFGKK